MFILAVSKMTSELQELNKSPKSFQFRAVLYRVHAVMCSFRCEKVPFCATTKLAGLACTTLPKHVISVSASENSHS